MPRASEDSEGGSREGSSVEQPPKNKDGEEVDDDESFGDQSSVDSEGSSQSSGSDRITDDGETRGLETAVSCVQDPAERRELRRKIRETLLSGKGPMPILAEPSDDSASTSDDSSGERDSEEETLLDWLKDHKDLLASYQSSEEGQSKPHVDRSDFVGQWLAVQPKRGALHLDAEAGGASASSPKRARGKGIEEEYEDLMREIGGVTVDAPTGGDGVAEGCPVPPKDAAEDADSKSDDSDGESDDSDDDSDGDPTWQEHSQGFEQKIFRKVSRIDDDLDEHEAYEEEDADCEEIHMTRANREIYEAQVYAGYKIHPRTFRLIMYELARELNPDIKFSNDALRALYYAAEDHLTKVFEVANKLRTHRGGDIVKVRDMALAHSLM